MGRVIGKVFVELSRIVTGALFVFSGLVKGVDVMGSAIKIEEYLNSFGLTMLADYSLWLSVALCSFELLLGLTTLLGIYRKSSARLVMLFLSLFTVLTIYIYIKSPVEDCGCFGDAVKLSNGETLLKNIILLVVALPLFLSSFNKEPRRFRRATSSLQFRSCVASTLVIIALFPSLYAIYNLPIIDFLPYQLGVNIQEASTIPEGAKEDVYETELIYQNIDSGENHTFSLSDTTWHDSSKWSFVDSKTVLIEEGFKPSIREFNIYNSEGYEITSDVLSLPKVAVIVIDKLPIPSSVEENIGKIYDTAQSGDIEVIIF